MTTVSNLRIAHEQSSSYSRNTGLGTALTKTIDLQFDDAGKLVAGTLGNTREFAFPVPLPPGVGGVKLPTFTKAIDVSDDTIQGLAHLARREAIRGGGITEIFTRPESRLISVVRGDRSRVERAPGAPTLDDAARLGKNGFKGIPVGTHGTEIARLGAALRRLI